jgi:hypothetical protein
MRSGRPPRQLRAAVWTTTSVVTLASTRNATSVVSTQLRLAFIGRK